MLEFLKDKISTNVTAGPLQQLMITVRYYSDQMSKPTKYFN